MTTATRDHRGIVSGEFDACAHRVSFWFDVGRLRHTDELLTTLEEEAEQRAREMIAQDYQSGQLCAVWKGEYEMFGWWQIERD